MSLPARAQTVAMPPVPVLTPERSDVHSSTDPCSVANVPGGCDQERKLIEKIRDLKMDVGSMLKPGPASAVDLQMNPPVFSSAAQPVVHSNVSYESPAPIASSEPTVLSSPVAYSSSGSDAKDIQYSDMNEVKSRIGDREKALDERLCRLFASLGLEKYITKFHDEEWDWAALMEITEQDIEQMGVKAGPRRKLMSAIRKLRQEHYRQKGGLVGDEDFVSGEESDPVDYLQSSSRSLPDEDGKHKNDEEDDITSPRSPIDSPHRRVVVPAWEVAYEDLQLTGYLGKGFYGNVYKGIWRNVEAAIKKIGRPVDFEKWLLEVRMLCTLRHPNVVSFFCACTKPPNCCIVTEYVKRGNLRALLADSSVALPHSLRLNMAIDAARGMTYLHSQNPPVIHRDLKADNLLVTTDWRVKVSDFGLSRFKDDTYSYLNPTSPFDVTITAPEALRENHISEKADVYSFGLVLWELVSREKPHNGKEPHWVAWAVATRKIRPSLPEDAVPSEYVKLMERCWAEDYASRPTFDEVLVELEKQLQHELDRVAISVDSEETPGAPLEVINEPSLGGSLGLPQANSEEPSSSYLNMP